MKKLIGSLIAIMMIGSGAALAADSVIVKETSTWKSVPIKVDSEKHTYVVEGTMPGEGVTEYYYSYPGYRCFSAKRDIVGVDAVIFSASVSGGSDIYCYAE